MKRILIVSTYLPPIAGGAEQVAWDNAWHLPEDYEIHILTTTRHHAQNTANRIHFHYLPYWYPLSLYCFTAGRFFVRKLLRKIKFDICHIHIPIPLALSLGNFTGKTIITCHGEDVYPPLCFFRKQITKYLFAKADVITAPSMWLCDFIRKEYDVDVIALPNGIDSHKFIPGDSSVDMDRPYFLYFGRYIERKGLKYLLEATKRLPQYRFVFAGSGAMESEIKGANIENVGFQKDITPYIQNALACILPSLWENFPLAGLEAMLCNKAVIATEKGFSEYIEHMKDGIIIKEKSVEEIVRALELIASDHALRRSIEVSAGIKAKQYGWDKIINSYIELYEKLTEQKANA